MAAVVAAAAVTCAVPSAATAGPEPMIVGGHPVNTAPPYMGSLQFASTVKGHHNFHLCAAVLVAAHAAVTNAHCVTLEPAAPGQRPQVQPEPLKIRFGSVDRLVGGQLAQVDGITVHPGFTGFGPDALGRMNDIAVLHLRQAVHLRPAVIGPATHRPVREIGWGLTDRTQTEAPRYLRDAQGAQMVPAQQCADDGIGTDELCIEAPAGAFVCNGDSGGPALQRFAGRTVAVGGVSRGATQNPDCTTQRGTIYLNYLDHIAFIRSAAGSVTVTLPRWPVHQVSQDR